MNARGSVAVSCTECPFSRVVAPDDEVLPADVVVEHGREFGHVVSVERLDE